MTPLMKIQYISMHVIQSTQNENKIKLFQVSVQNLYISDICTI